MNPLRRLSRAAKLALAKQMRHSPTSLERFAWSLLRNRGVLNLKFRRQHVLGGFIVDFVNLSAKIVIEIDGPYQRERDQSDYDRSRQEWLEAAGYCVVRVRERELSKDGLERILRPLAARDPRSALSPLPKGEGTEG